MRGLASTRRAAVVRMSGVALLAMTGACAASDSSSPDATVDVTAEVAAEAPTTRGTTVPEPIPEPTPIAQDAVEQPTTSAPADVATSQATIPADPTCPASDGLFPVRDEPVQVILDTDFAADVDDAGALAVLHALADAGEVEILAVMVSDGGDAPSHRAIDAINTYYGRPDVPIGVVASAAPEFSSSYVDALANDFPNDIQDPPAAVDLYREILESRPDDSVTIVSVGYLTNLDALLSSPPDERSSRSGQQLVADKVRRWVAMGGAYPDAIIHPLGAEFNFAEDATATANAVSGWPTRALFSGWEVGDVVLTGAVLQEATPPDNPVREAYRLFNGGQNRQSWDHTAVLVAVRGSNGLFEACAGRNQVGPGGSNSWTLDADGPHGFLRLVVPPAEVASIIDDLMTQAPAGA